MKTTRQAGAPRCRRCGREFEPARLMGRVKANCCEECLFRNLVDFLDLPTPPDLLDRFTAHPTLTEGEYRRRLVEMKRELEIEKRKAEG